MRQRRYPTMNDLPDPSERAAQIRSAHLDGEPKGPPVGPAHDALVEARIEADYLHRRAMRMVLDLDAACDDLGLFPDELHVELRDAQRRVRNVGEWAEQFADALEDELDY